MVGRKKLIFIIISIIIIGFGISFLSGYFTYGTSPISYFKLSNEEKEIVKSDAEYNRQIKKEINGNKREITSLERKLKKLRSQYYEAKSEADKASHLTATVSSVKDYYQYLAEAESKKNEMREVEVNIQILTGNISILEGIIRDN